MFINKKVLVEKHGVRAMKKTPEKQIRDLFAKHSIPPLEVIIPILEKTGRGEQELTTQVYDTFTSLAKGIKEILRVERQKHGDIGKSLRSVLGYKWRKVSPLS